MNNNQIVTDKWSNPASEALFKSHYESAPEYKEKQWEQCGGCSFFAKFNYDWGLCAFAKSPHYLETVLEHFTCPVTIQEGWGPHNFTEKKDFHCQCSGLPLEFESD